MTFKVGDHVLIARKVDWNNSWVAYMDSCVGKEGTVDNVVEQSSYGPYCCIRIPGHNNWCFPFSALELLDSLLPGHDIGNRHMSQELPP